MTESNLSLDSSAPTVLTEPRPDVLETTQLGTYIEWLHQNRGLRFSSSRALWQWSVDDLEGFWSSIWDFAGIRPHRPYDTVLGNRTMPGAQWSPGALLNYAAHSLGMPADAGRIAVIAHSQTREPVTMTFGDRNQQVTRARAALQRLGVKRGDRVVAYLPKRAIRLRSCCQHFSS